MRLTRWMLCLTAGLVTSSAAYGQQGALPALDTIQLTPYVWAAGLRGDISPFRRAPLISVDKKFSDVLSNLEVGGFLQLWLRKQKYVLFSDLMYVKTREKHHLAGVPIVHSITSQLTSEQLTGAILPGYQLWRSEQSNLSVLAGARYWKVSNHISLRGGPYQGQYGKSMRWVDPELGLRYFQRFSSRWSGLVQGHLGGWSWPERKSVLLQASVNYNFTDNLWASVGYRYHKVNYERDGHVFNTRLSGPAAGLTWRF